MSMIDSLGGGSSLYANALGQWQQQLFNKVDTNGDGSVTKTELEQAVSSAGGTTQSADALYAALDPNNSGSVSAQRFAQNLPLPFFSPGMGAQFIADQAQQSGTGTASDPMAQQKEDLFSKLDTNGDGSLTQAELEQAVTSAGGTKEAADALYAKLDPNNTGSVTQQQFVDNLPKPPHHHHHHQDDATSSDGSSASDGSSNGDDGNSAQDALAELLQSLGSTQNIAANNSDSSSGSDGGGNSAEDALRALLDSLAPSAQSASSTTGTTTTDNSAEAALLDLINAQNGSTTSSTTSSSDQTTQSTPAALFSKFNAQILALMLQLQSQNLAA